MEILLKRNGESDSSLPTTVSAGEPIWYKDNLYVGSVGTTVGGVATEGAPVAVGRIKDIEIESDINTYTFNPQTIRDYIVLKSPADGGNLIIYIDYEDLNNTGDHYILVHTPAEHSDTNVIFQGLSDVSYALFPEEAIVVPKGKAVEFSIKLYNPANSETGESYLVVTHSGEIHVNEV